MRSGWLIITCVNSKMPAMDVIVTIDACNYLDVKSADKCHEKKCAHIWRNKKSDYGMRNKICLYIALQQRRQIEI